MQSTSRLLKDKLSAWIFIISLSKQYSKLVYDKYSFHMKLLNEIGFSLRLMLVSDS